MIEFHKIRGIPTSVDPGKERVWFTDSALMYVASNSGSPVRIGAGFRQGSTVPVGTPPAAGILYFCTGNGEFYLSNTTKWNVLNTEAKTGGGSSGGYAGGVFMSDLGNYYTSNDVEGALQEIGASFPHFLGNRQLQNISTNLFAFDVAGERRVAPNTSNSPTTLSSWLTQRQASDGRTFGLMVAENGKLYTRSNDTFYEIASKAELTSAISTMNTNVSNAVAPIANYKIKAGQGISVSGTGAINSSPTISLKPQEVVQMIDSLIDTPFVKLSGDSMTGDLTIKKQTPSVYLNAEIAGQSTISAVRFFNSSVSGFAGLRDDNANRSFINYQRSDGTLYLNTGRESGGVQIDGQLVVNRPNTQSDRGLVVKTGNGHYISALENNNGRMSFLSTSETNYFQSDDGSKDHKPKDLVISARYIQEMQRFKVVAKESYFNKSVLAGTGVHLGIDDDLNGKLSPWNKLYMFGYKYSTSMAASRARRFYASMGFDQSTQTVYFSAQERLVAGGVSAKEINVSASKFITRSSEQYKTNIAEFNDNALDIVRGAKAWKYQLKNDESKRQNLGFIIERGVPSIAKEGDGKLIDSYAMLAIAWKAIQELEEKVEKLSK